MVKPGVDALAAMLKHADNSVGSDLSRLVQTREVELIVQHARQYESSHSLGDQVSREIEQLQAIELSGGKLSEAQSDRRMSLMMKLGMWSSNDPVSMPPMTTIREEAQRLLGIEDKKF